MHKNLDALEKSILDNVDTDDIVSVYTVQVEFLNPETKELEIETLQDWVMEENLDVIGFLNEVDFPDAKEKRKIMAVALLSEKKYKQEIKLIPVEEN